MIRRRKREKYMDFMRRAMKKAKAEFLSTSNPLGKPLKWVRKKRSNKEEEDANDNS